MESGCSISGAISVSWLQGAPTRRGTTWTTEHSHCNRFVSEYSSVTERKEGTEGTKEAGEGKRKDGWMDARKMCLGVKGENSWLIQAPGCQQCTRAGHTNSVLELVGSWARHSRLGSHTGPLGCSKARHWARGKCRQSLRPQRVLRMEGVNAYDVSHVKSSLQVKAFAIAGRRPVRNRHQFDTTAE